MDDRFEEGNPYRTPAAKNWDGLTLEEALKQAIARGEGKEIALLIQLLPEEMKAKYREIWLKAKGER